MTYMIGEVVLGRYTVARVLASKGMSHVYAVMDQALNKLVCLKEIDKTAAGRENINYHALLNEAQLLSKLGHSGIPRILSIEEEDTKVSILMDLVSGQDCEKIVNESGPMPEEEAVYKAVQLAVILGYLHSLPVPVFYRDLKPSNVLVQDGAVKLLDFGISVPVKPGMVIDQPLGTKGYAAPEQAKRGRPYDLRSDVYSFGRTLFFLLTGVHPDKTEAQNVRELIPEISPGLAAIVEKCCQINPDDRYQEFDEVLAALKTYRSVDSSVRMQYKRRRSVVISLASFGLICALASGGLVVYDHQRSAQQYEALINKAHSSGQLADYVSVSAARPNQIDPYFEALDIIRQGDGIFDDQEEKQLLSMLSESPDLSKDKRYPELAYQIGVAYWFLYQSTSNASGPSLSAKWFKTAMDGGYQAKQSEAFYNMALFNKDLATAIQTASDKGMYKTYWDLLSAVDTADLSEVMTLQLFNYLADCVLNYTYRLRSDGVERASIDQTVARIQGYLQANQPSPGRPTDLVASLNQKLQQLPEIMRSVYGEVPQS